MALSFASVPSLDAVGSPGSESLKRVCSTGIIFAWSFCPKHTTKRVLRRMTWTWSIEESRSWIEGTQNTLKTIQNDWSPDQSRKFGRRSMNSSCFLFLTSQWLEKVKIFLELTEVSVWESSFTLLEMSTDYGCITADGKPDGKMLYYPYHQFHYSLRECVRALKTYWAELRRAQKKGCSIHWYASVIPIFWATHNEFRARYVSFNVQVSSEQFNLIRGLVRNGAGQISQLLPSLCCQSNFLGYHYPMAFNIILVKR